MKIEELKDKRVKFSPRSITVKNLDGKTAGVVKGVTFFQHLQPNRQVDFFSKIRKAGAWENGLIANVAVCDGKLYYFHDTNADEVYQRLFANNPEMWPSETDRYYTRKNVAEAMAQCATVIPCHIIH